MSLDRFGNYICDIEPAVAPYPASILDGGGGAEDGSGEDQSGSGSPIGVKTPAYIGQGYTDTVPPYHQWHATGLTSADWFQIV